jgi:hypothetical protein
MARHSNKSIAEILTPSPPTDILFLDGNEDNNDNDNHLALLERKIFDAFRLALKFYHFQERTD